MYFQFFTEDPSVANTDYSNVAEDEVEVDDVEDDEAKGEEDDYVENNDVEEEKNMKLKKMMMMMMRRRRRRTDPKTGTPTLYEPAQSKCNWGCHKSHLFAQKNTNSRRPRARHRL